MLFLHHIFIPVCKLKCAFSCYYELISLFEITRLEISDRVCNDKTTIFSRILLLFIKKKHSRCLN